MAIATKVNLKGQGEQFDLTSKYLHGIETDVSLSSRLLSAIEAQRRRNKYVLWAIYALLFVLLIYVLKWYFSWLTPISGMNPHNPKHKLLPSSYTAE